MPKVKKSGLVNKVEEVTPEVVETKVEEVTPEVVETKVEEVTPEVVETKVEEVTPEVAEVIYPEVAGTGKFEHVKFEDGYVVYNPNGQRVTDKVDLRFADDTVRTQNLAMGL